MPKAIWAACLKALAAARFQWGFLVYNPQAPYDLRQICEGSARSPFSIGVGIQQ